MKLTDKKNIYLSILDEALSQNGYISFKSGGAPSFQSQKDRFLVHFFMNFKDIGSIDVSPVRISFGDVENIILEIGLPNIDLLEYKGKTRLHLPTITDMSVIESIKAWYKKHEFVFEDYCHQVETEEEVIRHAHAFLHYLNHEGAAFIEHYGYLPNILKEMDRLEAEGKKWSEVLSGYGDVYFRAIIISKLCDDPNYEKKLQLVDSFFNEPDEWQPYWEKLKALLPGIEPRYPYYK